MFSISPEIDNNMDSQNSLREKLIGLKMIAKMLFTQIEEIEKEIKDPKKQNSSNPFGDENRRRANAFSGPGFEQNEPSVGGFSLSSTSHSFGNF